MRKRIEELAEGKIPYEQPQVIFSKEKLELEVVEGQTATDSFQIKSENGIRMRGMIYSSNIRMSDVSVRRRRSRYSGAVSRRWHVGR